MHWGHAPQNLLPSVNRYCPATPQNSADFPFNGIKSQSAYSRSKDNAPGKCPLPILRGCVHLALVLQAAGHPAPSAGRASCSMAISDVRNDSRVAPMTLRTWVICALTLLGACSEPSGPDPGRTAHPGRGRRSMHHPDRRSMPQLCRRHSSRQRSCHRPPFRTRPLGVGRSMSRWCPGQMGMADGSTCAISATARQRLLR